MSDAGGGADFEQSFSEICLCTACTGVTERYAEYAPDSQAETTASSDHWAKADITTACSDFCF